MIHVSAETQKARIAGFIATEWHRLVGSVRGWIADTADRDAEDVVQDVLERMFEKADVSEPIADLSAYRTRTSLITTGGTPSGLSARAGPGIIRNTNNSPFDRSFSCRVISKGW